MEALKYHLLPERRLSLQSPRTKPRKSTVGVLYAVGGMDCTKGKLKYGEKQRNLIFRSNSTENGHILKSFEHTIFIFI